MHDFRAGKWGTEAAYFATIGAAEVGVILTGVGAERAGIATSGVIWGESETIGCCISSGLAGALRPEYKIGQVLAARKVFVESLGKDTEQPSFECKRELVSLAIEHGATAVDCFCTVDQVVATAEEKHRLGEHSDAAEMESFDVLGEAEEFGIPAIAIRAISDTVDQDLPLDMNQVFTDEGKVSIPRVIGQIALHPSSLAGLVRLGQHSASAAEALARFLDSYVQSVAVRTSGRVMNSTAAAG